MPKFQLTNFHMPKFLYAKIPIAHMPYSREKADVDDSLDSSGRVSKGLMSLVKPIDSLRGILEVIKLLGCQVKRLVYFGIIKGILRLITKAMWQEWQMSLQLKMTKEKPTLATKKFFKQHLFYKIRNILNPFEIILKLQEADSILWVGFALSN